MKTLKIRIKYKKKSRCSNVYKFYTKDITHNKTFYYNYYCCWYYHLFSCLYVNAWNLTADT